MARCPNCGQKTTGSGDYCQYCQYPILRGGRARQRRSQVLARKQAKEAEEAKQIGEALGIDWSKFDVEQYRMGLDVELEHGLIDPNTNVTNDDYMVTGKIALAHLNEFPDYYTRLEKMEREAEGR